MVQARSRGPEIKWHPQEEEDTEVLGLSMPDKPTGGCHRRQLPKMGSRENSGSLKVTQKPALHRQVLTVFAGGVGFET